MGRMRTDGDSMEMIRQCLNCTAECCMGSCARVKAGRAVSRGGRPRKVYEMDGERHTAYEWGRIYGVPGHLVARRLRDGLSVRDAVQKRRIGGRNRMLTARGMTLCITDWARLIDINLHSLWSWLNEHDGDMEAALDYYERKFGMKVEF